MAPHDGAATALNEILSSRPAAGAVSRRPTRQGRLTPLSLALCVALPLLLLGAVAPSLWQGAERAVLDGARRAATLLATQIRTAFEVQEALLLAGSQRVGGVGWDGMALDQYLHAALRDLDLATPSTAGLAVTDPAGRLVAHSRIAPPVPPGDLTDRDYVRAIRDGHAGIYVSGIFLSRPSNRRLFVLARRLPDEPGRDPGGAVISAFEEGSFAALGRSYLIDPGDTVALLRQAGDMLVRYPPVPEGSLDRFATPGSLQETLAAATAGETLRTRFRLDGLVRRIVFAPVPDFPIFVSYGVPESRLRAAALRALALPALLTVVVALLLLGATAYASNTRRRRHGLWARHFGHLGNFSGFEKRAAKHIYIDFCFVSGQANFPQLLDQIVIHRFNLLEIRRTLNVGMGKRVKFLLLCLMLSSNSVF